MEEIIMTQKNANVKNINTIGLIMRIALIIARIFVGIAFVLTLLGCILSLWMPVESVRIRPSIHMDVEYDEPKDGEKLVEGTKDAKWDIDEFSVKWYLKEKKAESGKEALSIDGEVEEITGSQIRLNYTDPVFCAQQSRIGHLSFKGTVEKSPAGGQDPVDVQLIFEGVADLTVHLQPKQVVASLELDKVFKLEDKDSHVYNCWISIKATGDQTNISVVDTMWPGMDLYNGTMPKIFNDLSQTTEFTDYTGFAFQPGDGRTFSTVINNLSDGQTVYVMYQVQVRDDMFDAALGQKYVEDNGYTGTDNYYPYGYEGVIPNRVTVSSDQVTGSYTSMLWMLTALSPQDTSSIHCLRTSLISTEARRCTTTIITAVIR